jgi:hypothetical protein
MYLSGRQKMAWVVCESVRWGRSAGKLSVEIYLSGTQEKERPTNMQPVPSQQFSFTAAPSNPPLYM